MKLTSDPSKSSVDGAGGDGWSFDSFRLWPDRGLFRADGEVPISPKPLALLVHLVRNRERIVSRQELLDAVWPDVRVSDAAFDSVVRDLRRSLEDDATRPRFIATRRRLGLRFIATVEELVALDARNAWEEAAVHFERAIEALELVRTGRGQPEDVAGRRPSRERGDLLVALARVRWSGGSTEAARDAFLAAADVGRRAGDGPLLAEAALGYAGRTDATPGVNHAAVALLEEACRTLSTDDSALRAELLARLGTEAYYDPDAGRSDRLTQEAVAMAERVGDPGILAYVSTSRHFALQRPDVAPGERIALIDRVFDLLADQPVSDVLAIALQERIVDLLELGDGEAFEAAFQRFRRVVDALDQPYFLWMASLFAGTRALTAGRIEEAELAAHSSFELGTEIGSPNAMLALSAQLFGVKHEQDKLEELVSVLDGLADEEALPIVHAGRAAAHAAREPRARARAALDEFFEARLPALSRDQHWISTLAILAPAVAECGRESQARELIEMLTPYRDRIVVVGYGATTHGAVLHHLGLLHEAVGERDVAGRRFADATELHESARAVTWVARSRAGQARCASA